MLQDKTVRLTPLEKRDLEKAREWVNDESNQELMLRVLPVTEVDQEKWYEEIVRNSSRMVFAIRTREDNKHIGNTGLYNIDWIHRRALFWILIGDPDYRGRGIGSEVILLMQRYAFDGLNLHRLYLEVDETNERAVAAYTRAGFRREGILRDHYYIRGTYRNILTMGFTREDHHGQK